MNTNHVLFSGYAKLPAGITASELYKTIAITVLVDIKTGLIIEADCTLATHLASNHIARIINGYNLNDGPEPLCQVIDRIYQGNAKKAIATAIRIIHDKYRNYLLEYGADNDPN